MVEETFLGVKGVISFTFNMSQRRCSLRVRSEVRPDALCHAVERSGSISAKQVIKNEQGEEVSDGCTIRCMAVPLNDHTCLSMYMYNVHVCKHVNIASKDYILWMGQLVLMIFPYSRCY